MLEQGWKKVYSRATTKPIPLLQPEHGFCQKNGSERRQTQDWYLNRKMVVVPFCLNGSCCSACRVRGFCIVLTKIKTMSLCLFRLFEEMLSMQFFWNTQRKRNYPRAIWEFEYPIWGLLWWQWHKTLLDTFWRLAYSEPTQASKMECFCANS